MDTDITNTYDTALTLQSVLPSSLVVSRAGTGEVDTLQQWWQAAPLTPTLGGSNPDITGLPRLAWEAASVVSGWARQSSPTHLVTTRLLLCWREEAGHQILCRHRSCLAFTL